MQGVTRAGRAQCFPRLGFVLVLHGLSVLMLPRIEALDLLEALKISTKTHQHPLQGTQLFFALPQANASLFVGRLNFEKKCDAASFCPQEATVSDGGKCFGAVLSDFTWQLLQALHVEF